MYFLDSETKKSGNAALFSLVNLLTLFAYSKLTFLSRA